MLGILPEYHVHYLGIRETSLKELICPRKRLYFWMWSSSWQASEEETSVYIKQPILGFWGLTIQRTLSRSFGGHTLKCKSLFFFPQETQHFKYPNMMPLRLIIFISFLVPIFFCLSVYFLTSHIPLINSPGTGLGILLLSKLHYSLKIACLSPN